MNPAPDADLHSVGEFYHKWVVGAVTDLVFKRLGETRPRARYRWDAFLNPEPTQQVMSAVASATEQAARTIVPEPVREAGSDLVAGVTGIVSDAASAVTDIVSSVIEPKSAGKAKAKRASDETGERKTAAKKSSPRSKKTSA
jgi:hypothetical protein